MPQMHNKLVREGEERGISCCFFSFWLLLFLEKPLQQNLDVAWAQIFNPSPGQITQSWLGAGEAARVEQIYRPLRYGASVL